ncbi:hypothetical protein ACHMW6_00130 (plasmid) [Pseudoduganella sp. UC29_106]|uniref:hypothetical protein n=1 Tax=Pseudoduganella sp. UC29_106 TaxID=3374553 RepID=UPI003756489D
MKLDEFDINATYIVRKRDVRLLDARSRIRGSQSIITVLDPKATPASAFDRYRTLAPTEIETAAAAEYLRVMDTSSKIDMLHPATIEYAFRIPNSVTDPDHEF